MGGRALLEANIHGVKMTGEVLLGGLVIAVQGSEVSATDLTFRHDDPVAGTRGASAPNALFRTAAESDPMGVNVGIADPFVEPDPQGFSPDPEQPMLYRLFDEGCSGADPNCRRCYLYGFDLGCERVLSMLDSGAADYETWATVRMTYNNGYAPETFDGRTNLPPGADLRFTGDYAVAAARGFEVGRILDGFGAGVILGINNALSMRGRRLEAPGGNYSAIFANFFMPPQQTDDWKLKIQWGNSGGSYNEPKRQELGTFINQFAKNLNCNKAFTDAGLTSPLKLLVNDGVWIGGAGWFNQGTGDDYRSAGFSTGAGADAPAEIRRSLLGGDRNAKIAQARTFRGDDRHVIDGRAHIILKSNTWNGALSWKEVIVHEFIHAAGRAGRPGGWNHDLTFMGQQYKKIMDACGAPATL